MVIVMMMMVIIVVMMAMLKSVMVMQDGDADDDSRSLFVLPPPIHFWMVGTFQPFTLARCSVLQIRIRVILDLRIRFNDTDLCFNETDPRIRSRIKMKRNCNTGYVTEPRS